MLRKASLDHDNLRDEARFILKNLQRNDLFGDPVSIGEAERVMQSALSLKFSEFVAFLAKYGYVRLGGDGQTITVTQGGQLVIDADDAEFSSRINRHFQVEEAKESSSFVRCESQARFSERARPIVRARRSISLEAPDADEVLDRRYQRGLSLGRGAIGIVYCSRHVGLRRPLAIKEAQPVFQYASYLRRDEIVRRLKHAVEVHAQLDHPYIIQIIDQNHEREHPYFVMELARGGNLRQRLVEAGEERLALPTAIRIITQVTSALQYAHVQGVIHFGLKPENILFDHLGNVKLSDFGMAPILEQPEGIGPAPILVGCNTVAYFAPERLQVDIHETSGVAGDIYSLGILFYETLTGKIPGRRSPLPSEARQGVPPAFDEVFDRMTRDSIDERYSSMDEVLEGIYRALGRDGLYEEGAMLSWAKDPGPKPSTVQPDWSEGEPELDLDIVHDTPIDPLETGEVILKEPRFERIRVRHIESLPTAAELDMSTSLPPPPPAEE